MSKEEERVKEFFGTDLDSEKTKEKIV